MDFLILQIYLQVQKNPEIFEFYNYEEKRNI